MHGKKWNKIHFTFVRPIPISLRTNVCLFIIRVTRNIKIYKNKMIHKIGNHSQWNPKRHPFRNGVNQVTRNWQYSKCNNSQFYFDCFAQFFFSLTVFFCFVSDRFRCFWWKYTQYFVCLFFVCSFEMCYFYCLFFFLSCK